MDTLDKVIQEWSYKTDKGYPDINSKKDMAVFESMFGFRLDTLIEQQHKDTGFNRLKYYKEYISRLIPSGMSVDLDGNKIVINTGIQTQDG